MPNVLRVWAYRVDASAVADAARRDQLRDAVRALAHEEHGTHDTVLAELRALAARVPDAAVELLSCDENFSWVVWRISDGEAAVEWLGLRASDGTHLKDPDALLTCSVAVGDAEIAGAIREQLAELTGEEPWIEDEESIEVPRHWPDAEALARGAELLAPHAAGGLMALAELGGETAADAFRLVRWRGGRADILQVLPVADDAVDAIAASSLWTHALVEVGMEGVDALARPSAAAPLTSGHLKARVAAVEALGPRPPREQLPALLAALADPANAGDAWVPVRQAIARAISWFDVPEVHAVFRAGLAAEHPEVVATLRYVRWRLAGLR